MEACLRTVGKMCKSLGRGIDKMGVKMEGRYAVIEECRKEGVVFVILKCYRPLVLSVFSTMLPVFQKPHSLRLQRRFLEIL